MKQDLKEDVRRHWEAAPCGAKLARAPFGTKEFFDEVERERYRLEPYIPEFAQFERWRGKRVLEIGVGLGTDFVQFARAGAILTGIDLTPTAVGAVRQRLEHEGLEADVLVADAEALPFEDASFDLVYSYGVLHHTSDPAQAVREIRRVVTSDGEARVMLYSRRSWFALGAWLRWGLGRGRPWHSISRVLAERLESPGTKAYTEPEVGALFAPFSSIELDRRITAYDRRVAGPLASLAGPRFGWFVGVVARP